MIVLIPSAIGQTYPAECEYALHRQTVPTQIVHCQTPGMIESQRKHIYDEAGCVGESASRQRCSDYAAHQSGYIAMQDRDCLHLQNDNLQSATAYLNSHPEAGAVALPWTNNLLEQCAHPRLLCSVWRAEVLAKMQWFVRIGRCSCGLALQLVRNLGYSFPVMPGVKCIVEVN